MFSKEDFLDYFDQILAIEREMKEIYEDLANRVTDPEYKEIFNGLADEEQGHERLVEALKKAFRG
jgi:rubrerythrin